MANFTTMQTFSKNVQLALAQKNWTIKQLSDHIQMDRSDVSKIVRGVNGCNLDTAVLIARALRIPISVLVEDFSEILSASA